MPHSWNKFKVMLFRTTTQPTWKDTFKHVLAKSANDPFPILVGFIILLNVLYMVVPLFVKLWNQMLCYLQFTKSETDNDKKTLAANRAKSRLTLKKSKPEDKLFYNSSVRYSIIDSDDTFDVPKLLNWDEELIKWNHAALSPESRSIMGSEHWENVQRKNAVTKLSQQRMCQVKQSMSELGLPLLEASLDGIFPTETNGTSSNENIDRTESTSSLPNLLSHKSKNNLSTLQDFSTCLKELVNYKASLSEKIPLITVEKSVECQVQQDDKASQNFTMSLKKAMTVKSEKKGTLFNVRPKTVNLKGERKPPRPNVECLRVKSSLSIVDRSDPSKSSSLLSRSNQSASIHGLLSLVKNKNSAKDPSKPVIIAVTSNKPSAPKLFPKQLSKMLTKFPSKTQETKKMSHADHINNSKSSNRCEKKISPAAYFAPVQKGSGKKEIEHIGKNAELQGETLKGSNAISQESMPLSEEKSTIINGINVMDLESNDSLKLINNVGSEQSLCSVVSREMGDHDLNRRHDEVNFQSTQSDSAELYTTIHVQESNQIEQVDEESSLENNSSIKNYVRSDEASDNSSFINIKEQTEMSLESTDAHLSLILDKKVTSPCTKNVSKECESNNLASNSLSRSESESPNAQLKNHGKLGSAKGKVNTPKSIGSLLKPGSHASKDPIKKTAGKINLLKSSQGNKSSDQKSNKRPPTRAALKTLQTGITKPGALIRNIKGLNNSPNLHDLRSSVSNGPKSSKKVSLKPLKTSLNSFKESVSQNKSKLKMKCNSGKENNNRKQFNEKLPPSSKNVPSKVSPKIGSKCESSLTVQENNVNHNSTTETHKVFASWNQTVLLVNPPPKLPTEEAALTLNEEKMELVIENKIANGSEHRWKVSTSKLNVKRSDQSSVSIRPSLNHLIGLSHKKNKIKLQETLLTEKTSSHLPVWQEQRLNQPSKLRSLLTKEIPCFSKKSTDSRGSTKRSISPQVNENLRQTSQHKLIKGASKTGMIRTISSKKKAADLSGPRSTLKLNSQGNSAFVVQGKEALVVDIGNRPSEDNTRKKVVNAGLRKINFEFSSNPMNIEGAIFQQPSTYSENELLETFPVVPHPSRSTTSTKSSGSVTFSGDTMIDISKAEYINETETHNESDIPYEPSFPSGNDPFNVVIENCSSESLEGELSMGDKKFRLSLTDSSNMHAQDDLSDEKSNAEQAVQKGLLQSMYMKPQSNLMGDVE